MRFNSDELLEQFGETLFTKGKWCRKNDCLKCQFFWTCPPKKPKLGKDDGDCDYVIRNLTHGWKLDNQQFHLETRT